jgi:O-antigen ligase
MSIAQASMPIAEAGPQGAALRKAICAAMVVWVAGFVLAEPIAQVGSFACLALALVGWKRAQVPRDLRRFVAAAAALAAWQAVSPAFSSMPWPKSGRYGQFADTLAPASLAVVAQLVVPWAAVACVAAFGWALSCALGLYQHFVRWPLAQWHWFKTPVTRVQESFSVSGPPRYGAGGFLFHRLRFAHGATALLGPALAVARSSQRRAQVAAALALAALLLISAYISYARAALLIACALVALLAFERFRAWALAGGGVLLALVCASADWRHRLALIPANLFGPERSLSMEVGWKLVRAHPLLGVGFGNHQDAAWAAWHQTLVNPLLAIDSHDLWLTAWVETGAVGLALTVAYHAALGAALVRRLRQGSPAAFGGLLAFGAFHALSLVHYLQHHTGVYLSFAFVWGLSLAGEEPLRELRRLLGRARAASPGSPTATGA